MHEYDVKKVHKELYDPPVEPALVHVPPLLYSMVEGEGNAGDENYEEAVRLLVAVSNALHSGFKGYQSFTIAPLECLWSPLEVENRKTWRWSLVISQPDWLTEEIFMQVRDQVAFKQGLSTSDLHLITLEEGLCVTILHIGSYRDEAKSFVRMQAFCDERNLRRVGTSHREIYLGNPKQAEHSLLRTVLRFPVARIQPTTLP